MDDTTLNFAEAALGRMARRQHGVFSWEQALAMGLTRDRVRYRVKTSEWEPIFRGVYTVLEVPRTRYHLIMACVLSGGSTAVASHFTAAEILGLPAPHSDLIHVTTASDHQLRQPNFVGHRSYTLDEVDLREIDSIPVTGAARVIVDLSGRISEPDLEKLIDAALRRRLTSIFGITKIMGKARRGPGRKMKLLEALLSSRLSSDSKAASELESQFLRVVRCRRFPEPVPQYPVLLNGRQRYIDFAYPARMLAIELDSYEHHHDRPTFEDDRARQNELVLAGWRVLRFTHRMSDDYISQQMNLVLYLCA